MKALQLEFFVSTDSDPEPEAECILGVLPLKNKKAEQAAELLVSLLDLADDEPGDGEIDLKEKVKIPSFKLFGKMVTVNAEAKCTAKIVTL